MGVCRFFQQGNCRFGAKCHNEHFDVKQYLKSDIESCLNGKMWPFSVYGPFKDKPNIPDYIEDQSFEEVRYQAYESQRQNCFDQFHQQFAKQMLETTNKMQIMLQCSPRILDVMIKLYEAPEGMQAAGNNRNPFSASGNNCGQAGSIFSKPTSTSSNIFNNSADATNGFASTGKSIFGGSSMSGNNAGNNIFGGSTSTNFFVQQQQPQPSVFGQQQHQPSIFGQVLPQHQMNAIGNVQPHNLIVSSSNNFLSQTQSPNMTFAQGFALQRAQQPTQQPSTIFGQAASTTISPNIGNSFAQTATQTSTGLFGSFQKPQQQQTHSEAMQQMHPLTQQITKAEANSSIYSPMEDLSHEEIAAFKAEQFTPGQVPFNPPPRELC